MSDSSVSVVVRCYNRAGSVARSLRSALNQSLPPCEVIVIDDGSTDDSRVVVEAIEGVQYVYQENQGVAGAREAGLRAARGDLIAFLDSDDFWDPDFLETAVAGMDLTGADFVFCNWRTEGPGVTKEATLELDNLAYLEANGKPVSGWFFLNSEQTRQVFLSHCPAISSATLLRRRLLSTGWNTEVLMTDDWAMMVGAVIEHRVTSAFRLDRKWTRWIDDTNICEGVSNAGQRPLREVHDVGVLLRQFNDHLTRSERRGLRHMIHRAQFDLGYVASVTGRPLDALAAFCRAWGGVTWWRWLLAVGKIPAHWLRSRSSLTGWGQAPD